MRRQLGQTHHASSAYVETFKIFAFLLLVILGSFYLLNSVILPIIIAFTLYALFEPVYNYLCRRDYSPSFIILFLLILMLTLSILAISVALPQLLEQATLLKNRLPQIFGQLEQFLTHYMGKLGHSLGVELEVSEILVSILSQSSSIGNTLLLGISEQIFAITLGLILVPILTFFILKDYKSLRNTMMNWLPNSSFELGWLIYYRVTRQLQFYIRGVMIQSTIMAVVASLGFWLIGLDIAILLGSLTGLLNLIPYIGPLISMILAVLVASAMTPFDPSMIALAVGVIVFAQVFDNLVVIPMVIASAVDLHPVPVIVGIIIFGNLFGMLGVILAIPAIAAAKIIYQTLYIFIYNANNGYKADKSIA